MKLFDMLTVAAVASLALMASSASAFELEELTEDARSLGRFNPAKCPFQCPANSRRMKRRRCPKDFGACVCDHGFKKQGGKCLKQCTVTVRNLANFQPFSPILVVVHNDKAPALYAMGEAPSEVLTILAEDGNSQPAADFYGALPSVSSAVVEGGAGPSGAATFDIMVNDEFSYLTVGTMAVNTNDCFVSLNGVKVYDGARFNTPGLDAGSEGNDEKCSNLPGPACPPDSGNAQAPNGEGFVHVHRGIQQIADLEGDTDWRNPMMRATISC